MSNCCWKWNWNKRPCIKAFHFQNGLKILYRHFPDLEHTITKGLTHRGVGIDWGHNILWSMVILIHRVHETVTCGDLCCRNDNISLPFGPQNVGKSRKTYLLRQPMTFRLKFLKNLRMTITWHYQTRTLSGRWRQWNLSLTPAANTWEPHTLLIAIFRRLQTSSRYPARYRTCCIFITHFISRCVCRARWISQQFR